MRIDVELNEKDIQRLVLRELKLQMPEAEIAETDIQILVKSKQNYKSEWENAAFKVVLCRHNEL